LHTGYTVGAGIEVALTDNITLRGEYLYDDYGSQSYEYDLTDLPDPYDVVVTNDVGLTAQTVRVGLSFSF
jgi:opacity protein-like surface antigen